MRVVVLGGTGLIGSKLVRQIREKGAEAVAASPRTGVNIITGEGLLDVLLGADVVVDVTNSPSMGGQAVSDFFEEGGKKIAAAEKSAGVKHHVALSIVGADRLQGSGYFRGKNVQERNVAGGSIPFTLIHSTQFYEFLRIIGFAGVQGDLIRVPHARCQLIAANDAASALATLALAPPLNKAIEIAGPNIHFMDDLVAKVFTHFHDPHSVVGDPDALYFGAKLDDHSLLPNPGALLGVTTFDDWFAHITPPAESSD